MVHQSIFRQRVEEVLADLERRANAPDLVAPNRVEAEVDLSMLRRHLAQKLDEAWHALANLRYREVLGALHQVREGVGVLSSIASVWCELDDFAASSWVAREAAGSTAESARDRALENLKQRTRNLLAQGQVVRARALVRSSSIFLEALSGGSASDVVESDP